MTDQTVMAALANEARRGEVKQRIAQLMGKADAAASLMTRVSSMSADTLASLETARAELAALDAGAGPGITADFGVKSSVTQLVEAEREAAKAAVVDLMQSDPSCTEDQAAAAWTAAAIASHPQIPFALQDAKAMSYLYRANLVALQKIPDMEWQSWHDWLAATPRATILDM